MLKLAQTDRPTDRPTDQQTGQKQYVPHYYNIVKIQLLTKFADTKCDRQTDRQTNKPSSPLFPRAGCPLPLTSRTQRSVSGWDMSSGGGSTWGSDADQDLTWWDTPTLKFGNCLVTSRAAIKVTQRKELEDLCQGSTNPITRS
ncbi:hypothetical protein DPMN_024888 [Dreissena polymorpha]|uniref:Uncharacterized protein n=1 Tax=Dreissena polymorpha TaxID=45954 RepID=A0A9D4LQ81_DREPO|nr:hypothetical protein DPMN_024888 [Dreissena polymorpha]